MKASRLLSLPPYLFEELENRYNAAVADGRVVIDLSIGDPDLPPPQSALDNLHEFLPRKKNHRYPPQRGSLDLKAAVRRYLERRAGVAPDDDQILILIGSKEGIAHLPWAVCNPGDRAVVPDPGYPVYSSAAAFAGCDIDALRLDPDGGFLPDLDDMRNLTRDARIAFLNYPNNPTAATATAGLFDSAVAIASDFGTVMVNDAAYADVYFDGATPPLLCGAAGALDNPTVEFFSFSKSFSMTGWRVGFAVGRADIIEALAHLKANIDSGAFTTVQEAVATTLDTDGDAYMEWMRAEYQRRRDVTVERLAKLGFDCLPCCATFYVWARVPGGHKSMDYAMRVLDGANVLVTPGVGFGAGGEGFFRIALTRPVEDLETALERIAAL